MSQLSGDRAVIVQHCAVFGRLETEVRKFIVGDVRPWAQYDCAVSVSFVKPRKRRWYSYTMYPENIRYLTIEVDGKTIYDSRDDVPCDMSAWVETDTRFIGKRSRV